MPSGKGGIGEFGQRPPIFERSTKHELVRFVKGRELDRRAAEAKKRAPGKRQARETSPSIVPRNDLQIVFTNEGATPRKPKKLTRWDKVDEAGEKLLERPMEVDESKAGFVSVAGAAPVENDIVDEDVVSVELVEMQVEVAAARPNPDPRTRLGAARPRALENELPLVVAPVEQASGGGERPVVPSTMAELPQEMDKLLVHQGGGKFEVREGYLLRKNYVIPPKATVDGTAGAVSQVVQGIAPSQRSFGVVGLEPLTFLTRAQRRGRMAKEWRDRVSALERENAALRANPPRNKRSLEFIYERAEICGVFPPREVIDFANYLDRRMRLK